MKKFIWKTLSFVSIPIMVLLFADITLNLISKSYSLFDYYSFNDSIESKISKLPVSDSVTIIIAGDSRAERQLLPNIFESILNIKSINIAVMAGDLALTVPAINQYSDSNIFIISASSWQINDGAIDPGYLSLRCFLDLTLIEQLFIYRNNFREFLRMKASVWKHTLNKCIVRKTKYYYDADIISEDGFLGIEKTLEVDTTRINSLLSSHPWYRNIKFDGARWRIFSKNIEKLAKKKSLIIIYQPPVSPIWKEMTENSEIGHIEKEYSKRLDSICNKFTNVVFYDFYSNDIKILENSMYYDYQHLNRNGAEEFSKIFSEMISKEIKARAHNTLDYSRGAAKMPNAQADTVFVFE